MLLVDVQTCFVGIGVVQPKRDQRVHDFLHEALIDSIAVSLLFDKTEDGTSKFGVLLLDRYEKVVSPLDERELSYDESLGHDDPY